MPVSNAAPTQLSMQFQGDSSLLRLVCNLPRLQVTFSILIVLQTWLSPLQGCLVDKFGPRVLIAFGCALSGAGWIASAYIKSLIGLYLTYGLSCGVGTGIVYIGIIGLMVRWFPDRRGFAIGMVAAGYGFGAILTTLPINSMLKSDGYQHTLVVFGFILGIIGALAALAGRTRSCRQLPSWHRRKMSRHATICCARMCSG